MPPVTPSTSAVSSNTEPTQLKSPTSILGQRFCLALFFEMRTMKRILMLGLVLLAAGTLFAWIVFSNFSMASMPEPGKNETYLATRAKHLLINRAARAGIPPRPLDRVASAKEGDNAYTMRCTMCHGEDGRTLSPMGRWMYPRAADLTSPAVQSYSDQELFWVVKNGVRLSGMPAFGKLETDDHIWNVVDYIRTLPLAKK
jgi:mono/diheme cytochrome c family protein